MDRENYENKNQYMQVPMNGGSECYGSTTRKGQSRILGIFSFICMVVSPLTMCCTGWFPLAEFLPFVFSFASIALGIIQIAKNEKKGLGIAGIVLGVCELMFYVGIIIFFAIATGNA